MGFLTRFSVAFGKKIKSFFFQEDQLELRGNLRITRLEEELKFISAKFQETDRVKGQKSVVDDDEYIPGFVRKMRSHFWNIHQFFCDLVLKKVTSELRSLKDFNSAELETLQFRLNKEFQDSKKQRKDAISVSLSPLNPSYPCFSDCWVLLDRAATTRGWKGEGLSA